MLQRITTVAILMLLATPAAAEWRIPYLSALFGSGCSVTFVSPEYAARPVQPLNPQAALVEVNAFRAKNGLKPLWAEILRRRPARLGGKLGRHNLLLPDVSAAGVAMAKNETGRAYWTLVLGAE
jgi:uncharacterized protein YkwD